MIGTQKKPALRIVIATRRSQIHPHGVIKTPGLEPEAKIEEGGARLPHKKNRLRIVKSPSWSLTSQPAKTFRPASSNADG